MFSLKYIFFINFSFYSFVKIYYFIFNFYYFNLLILINFTSMFYLFKFFVLIFPIIFLYILFLFLFNLFRFAWKFLWNAFFQLYYYDAIHIFLSFFLRCLILIYIYFFDEWMNVEIYINLIWSLHFKYSILNYLE